MNLDDLPLGMFEVDCDGSACGSRAALHVHAPQYGMRAVARVTVRAGARTGYAPPEGITRLVMSGQEGQ